VLHRIIRSWYTGRWWVGCYIWYIDEGPAWAGCGPAQSPSRCTKYNSPPINGSVPITALLYDGSLLCGFKATIKGLTPRRHSEGFTRWRCPTVCLFVCSFVCRLKRVLVGHWPDWPSSAGGRERPQRCWASQASARHTNVGGGLLCRPQFRSH